MRVSLRFESRFRVLRWPGRATSRPLTGARRRRLKRASFTSVEDLRQRLLAFMDYFNRTMAKPFQWTYTGRPLVV